MTDVCLFRTLSDVQFSRDQTARVFSGWNRSGVSTWHEIARSQVHGYDLSCAAFVRPFQYVCGADEKVIRVFDAPNAFLKSLALITNKPVSLDSSVCRCRISFW